ncbi:MAG: Condensin complex subunit [Geoglossum umbratile]|nr:MAG: Condensin complex subunit [Geoglossum umbratile]
MEDLVNFDLNDSLKYYLSDPATVPTAEAASELLDCENDPESLTSALINGVLNPIVDSVAENPDAIATSSSFDSLQFLLKCAPICLQSQKHFPTDPDSELFLLSRSASYLPPQALSKIFDLIVSGLSTENDILSADVDNDDQGTLQHHRTLLEIYGFLLQWSVAAVETKAAEKPAPPAKGRGGKASKAKSKSKDDNWDPSGQLQGALATMCKILGQKLSKIFLTTSERDTFVNLFTRSAYLVLENEQRVKSKDMRMHAFKVLCLAVKHHGHAFGAQTSIIQNLSYFEHLSEPMAEFLQILSDQFNYPQLVDEILRELSGKEFNSNDNRGPKSVSSFIIKLSELLPRLVMKQMTLLAKQLDSESYTLRCAIIETCGNLVVDMAKQAEQSENHEIQINAYFDLLEERFLDLNPYCRCRAIQVCVKLCDLEMKRPQRRLSVARLAARSLEDKSSNVRRNAIKLLGRLVSTNPFSGVNGGQLSFKDWEDKLRKVDANLAALKPPPGLAGEQSAADVSVDEGLLDEVTEMDVSSPKRPAQMSEEEKVLAVQKATEEAATSAALEKLQLTKIYCTDALRFIETLHGASEIVCQLLSSKNKSEVIEAMDFFVITDAYKVEAAKAGIRRMLRLIWTKGNSDEGKGVQTHLIECYKGLFFDTPVNFDANDAANYIGRNMISLTFGATPAELTSLEQLLSSMVKAGHISDLVVSKLWQVYGVQRREISRSQRRGAIIVLGMLALADPDIVVKEMETMLRIGLGPLGRADLVLAKYTCIALSRINPIGRKAKESTPTAAKLPNDHAILVKLAAITEMSSDSKEWFGVAEQAIGAIYALSKHPDTLCSDILRRRTKSVFNQRPLSPHKEVTDAGEDLTPTDDQQHETFDNQNKGAPALSQLLFIVGHVAIKQIVHLELCELDFKRRKAENSKSKPSGELPSKTASADQDELDLIGGTTEDDFTEAMAHIRERELLYGENSLLANFGPLVSEICSNNTAYKNRDLQAAAALCMAKLMCVSSEYCEKNLPLLITIMERSKDPVTRSNVVIALGDMAVCFNHLIDENTDFLYRRLSDDDASVKRTCLMTLTFLILAGQVKVKGQLGEMAKCLEHPDKRIADLSRMFFSELSTKDNAVYNHFVDMFSLLSAEKDLEENALRRIIKFLASFIEKDKHAKQLADKLAARLARCDNERQWNDVAYALSLLQHKNEDIQKTVTAGYRMVQASA